MRFANKHVLVTGGTSGMGLAGARRILAEGGRVIATGRNAKRIEAARATLGSDAIVVTNDAGDPDAAEALADLARSEDGLDGLWLNAAFAALGAAIAVLLLVGMLAVILGSNRYIERRYAQVFES